MLESIQSRIQKECSPQQKTEGEIRLSSFVGLVFTI